MLIKDMSGLEVLQAMVAGKIPPPSIAATIPMRLVSIEQGKVIFEATADDRHLNPMGGVHGGFAATVMDTVTGCAVHSVLEPGASYGTVDLNVKMVRPVPKNITLIAEGRLINASKTIGISDGILQDSEGRIYAHASATCKIMRPAAAK